MDETNGNAAAFFVDRHLGKGYDDKPAFVEGTGAARQISYAELASETDKMADLYARHGINREDRVAMLILDQLEFPVVFWGSLKAGVLPIALNNPARTRI